MVNSGKHISFLHQRLLWHQLPRGCEAVCHVPEMIAFPTNQPPSSCFHRCHGSFSSVSPAMRQRIQHATLQKCLLPLPLIRLCKVGTLHILRKAHAVLEHDLLVLPLQHLALHKVSH